MSYFQRAIYCEQFTLIKITIILNNRVITLSCRFCLKLVMQALQQSYHECRRAAVSRVKYGAAHSHPASDAQRGRGRCAAAGREEKHCWGSLLSWTCKQVTSFLADYKSAAGSLQCLRVWGGGRSRGGRGQLKMHAWKRRRKNHNNCVKPLRVKKWWNHLKLRPESKHLPAVLNCTLSSSALKPRAQLGILKPLNTKGQLMGGDGNKFTQRPAGSRQGKKLSKDWTSWGLGNLNGVGKAWHVCAHRKGKPS